MIIKAGSQTKVFIPASGEYWRLYHLYFHGMISILHNILSVLNSVGISWAHLNPADYDMLLCPSYRTETVVFRV